MVKDKKMTIIDISTLVMSRHDVYELPDTVSGVNVELDGVAQFLNEHNVVVFEDVLSQGSFSINTIGSYNLRRQMHFAFMSKVRLDETGVRRQDLLEELLRKAYNTMIDFLNELEHYGYTSYASPTYVAYTNKKDANMNMVDVQLFIEDPAQNCHEYED